MLSLLDPLSSQWQVALLALCAVMGALIWRAHRQVTSLGRTSSKMAEQLARLGMMVEEIGGHTTNTEHTLIANLSEYRMALDNTSSYRDYLQKLGVATGADIDPVLEAVPDGAFALSRDGRVLYVNQTLSETTGIGAGMTVDEIVTRYELRSVHGDALAFGDLPMQRVLRGERVREALLRLTREGALGDVILSVNGAPARDAVGRVVAAVLICRQVSEEIALAMEVRQLAEAPRSKTESGSLKV